MLPGGASASYNHSRAPAGSGDPLGPVGMRAEVMLPHLHLHPALPAAGSPSTRRGTRARGGGGGGERMPPGGSPAVIFLPPATAGERGRACRQEGGDAARGVWFVPAPPSSLAPGLSAASILRAQTPRYSPQNNPSRHAPRGPPCSRRPSPPGPGSCTETWLIIPRRKNSTISRGI